MDTYTEITEGAIVSGKSPRTRTECIFEVRARINSWLRPVPGTLYIVEEDEHHCIKLRSPIDDNEVADTTVFIVQDCYIPDSSLLEAYIKKPNI